MKRLRAALVLATAGGRSRKRALQSAIADSSCLTGWPLDRCGPRWRRCTGTGERRSSPTGLAVRSPVDIVSGGWDKRGYRLRWQSDKDKYSSCSRARDSLFSPFSRATLFAIKSQNPCRTSITHLITTLKLSPHHVASSGPRSLEAPTGNLSSRHDNYRGTRHIYKGL